MRRDICLISIQTVLVFLSVAVEVCVLLNTTEESAIDVDGAGSIHYSHSLIGAQVSEHWKKARVS